MAIDLLIPVEQDVAVPAGAERQPGTLAIPANPSGLVLFAGVTGIGPASFGDAAVAGDLRGAGLGTLVFDLLTPGESVVRANTYDIELLAGRLSSAARWLAEEYPGLPIGLYGTGTGAAAALVTAAREGERVGAVVCRAGRPDLAWETLPQVPAPTLLIVGANDTGLIAAHQAASRELRCINRLLVVPGAGQAFETGLVQREVGRSARSWFVEHLTVRRRWAPRARPILHPGVFP